MNGILQSAVLGIFLILENITLPIVNSKEAKVRPIGENTGVYFRADIIAYNI
jgi:hypothetical protein